MRAAESAVASTKDRVVGGAEPAGAVGGDDRGAEVADPGSAAGVVGAGDAAGPAVDRVLALIVPAGEHGPQVRAIHRVLPATPLDEIDVRRFRSEPVGPLGAAAAEELLAGAPKPLVLATDGDRWLRLTEPDTTTITPAAWQSLDVALVDVLLIGRQPRVVLRHAVEAAVDAARRDRGVALLVRPTPTATVLEVAALGVLMPRKSTFFVPKPRTGLVLRCFADQRGKPESHGLVAATTDS